MRPRRNFEQHNSAVLQNCITKKAIRYNLECGADLRQEAEKRGGQTGAVTEASVPMVHSIPELKVCPELAEKIGKEDEQRLLQDRKLALLVDLDQTIVHTTNDNVPANMKDVFHYQLYGPNSPWYHTRLRPGTRHFLSEMSRLYELHICTFGARNYAHTVAALLDKEGALFSHRILSRDECFDPASKTANLKALFPCGDDMVCIIDDREDVWQGCGNLVQVKPYHFFRHTGDIHAPPGLEKKDVMEIPEPADDVTTGYGDSTLNTGGAKSGENGEVMGVIEDVTIGEEVLIKENSEGVNNKNESAEEKKIEKTGLNSENTTEKKPKDKQHPQIMEEKSQCEESHENPEQDEFENQQNIENSKDKKLENEHLENLLPKESEVKPSPENCDPKEINEVEQNKESTIIEKTSPTTNENSKNEEVDHEDHDDYLLYLEDILRKIHAEFYEHLDQGKGRKSLREIIPRVRARVLKGLCLTFSGLIPTHQKLHQSRVYKVAKAFGAEVTQDLTDKTTHLVAIKPGTAKANAAKKNKNIKIVNPDWLWLSAERWERVDERLFPLTAKARASRIPPPHCSSPERVEEPQNEVIDSFADSINPLMSFSAEEIENMDKEVDEDMDDPDMDYTGMEFDEFSNKRMLDENSDSEGSDNDANRKAKRKKVSKESSSEDSSDEKDKYIFQRYHKEDEEGDDDDDPVTRFRRGEDLPDDLDLGDNSQDSIGDPPGDEGDEREWNALGAALEREFLTE
ncbi:RNA polymerase II subunit A C-terminal domain phosphatase isoform X2 [Venturia canescens]|uniref:RNA polymerase II subunit A C-terminal domain phosphatase isoform X2 n=1 Tax=Venturia canescens TaxID=32260 RepID=UPI001C9CC6FE|nr:RNA polymerase II subunit A C-terminal domain phosphatase isoform X2 [Venturia canescens]